MPRNLAWLTTLLAAASLAMWSHHAPTALATPNTVTVTIPLPANPPWSPEDPSWHGLPAIIRRHRPHLMLQLGGNQLTVTGPLAEVHGLADMLRRLQGTIRRDRAGPPPGVKCGMERPCLLVLPLESLPWKDCQETVLCLFPDVDTKPVPGQNMLMVKGPRDWVLGAKVIASWLDAPSP